MKKIIPPLFGLLFTCVMIITQSCTPNNATNDNEKPNATTDVYYVKYASNGLEGTYSVNYTAEDGQPVYVSNIKGADFERTIGPVSKGFEANFTITSTLNYTTVAVRIEVKKNNEPFIVKKESVTHSKGFPCTCGVKYTVE